MAMHSHDLIPIGKMADLCSTSVKTLRFYHQIGLLEPALIDPETGYRYYSVNQFEVVDLIKQLQYLGVPLEAIAKVKQQNSMKALVELLSDQRQALQQQRRETNQKIRFIENIIERCAEQEVHAPFNIIHVRHHPATPILRLGSSFTS